MKNPEGTSTKEFLPPIFCCAACRPTPEDIEVNPTSYKPIFINYDKQSMETEKGNWRHQGNPKHAAIFACQEEGNIFIKHLNNEKLKEKDNIREDEKDKVAS